MDKILNLKKSYLSSENRLYSRFFKTTFSRLLVESHVGGQRLFDFKKSLIKRRWLCLVSFQFISIHLYSF